ncbi:Arc family DNA-binding protein [Rhizobium grahamii]|uniref:Arc-like DNA binding domain-containing protein n=1 Tax=Rhizobium grahamii CCGE 502 TaxID=990285 RepID=S3HHZ6_9HYPH|nr:Arc family DNA-binding protein [Rhizobium grahamii]EPE98447.1 hypothetical protein RGCCGE502_08470 [Rhizobium grahamii CCGE 502]
MPRKPRSSEHQNAIPVSVRMPKPVRDRLFASAEGSRRSMNSEIIFLLEVALTQKEKAEAAATVSAS